MQSAAQKRAWRAKKAAQAFVDGMTEAGLSFLGVQVARGIMAEAARLRHLEGTKKANKARYWSDPETARAKGRAHMKAQRAADPEKFNAKDRARWRTDASRRERMRGWSAKYATAHPEAKQARRLLRVARQKGAPGRYTTDDIVAQFNAQSGMCFYCVRPMASFQIEHKTPICRGGTNWPENIVCACALCNQRKGKRTAEEFLAIVHAEQVANDREAA